MKQIKYVLIISYLFLNACNGTNKTATNLPEASQLNGTWELNYMDGLSVGINSLFPNQKPFIFFDVANKSLSGNTGCNNFHGALKVEGSKIDFTSPMAMTRMMCLDGVGESTFLQNLSKVNTYSVVENTTLHLISNEVVIMKFKKK